MDITIWKSTKCPLKLLLRNILSQSFELNLCCSRKSPTTITAVFILSLLIFFYHNSFFLNISVNSPISSLHAPLIIKKSASVRDFGKEANQKYLKMWSIDPWWVLIILDMRALLLLFCFVLFFRNLMIILMVSQNIMTYQKSAGLNDLPIILITLISRSLERKQTNCSFSQWILLGKTYCT